MADWTPSSPALSETISAAFANIRGNWAALASAWSGDHKALTGDGTNSIAHEKLTMPEIGVAPAAVADTGFVYTNEDAITNKTELYFKDEDNNEVQLTNSGSVSGETFAYGHFDITAGVVTLGNSKNIDSVTRLGFGIYEIKFKTPVGSSDYTVVTGSEPVNPVIAGRIAFSELITYNKLSAQFNIINRTFIVGGSSVTGGPSDAKDINFAVYKV